MLKGHGQNANLKKGYSKDDALFYIIAQFFATLKWGLSIRVDIWSHSSDQCEDGETWLNTWSLLQWFWFQIISTIPALACWDVLTSIWATAMKRSGNCLCILLIGQNQFAFILFIHFSWIQICDHTLTQVCCLWIFCQKCSQNVKHCKIPGSAFLAVEGHLSLLTAFKVKAETLMSNSVTNSAGWHSSQWQ